MVHGVRRRPQRGLFPDARPPAGSRRPPARQRRRNLLPRHPSRHGVEYRVPGRARTRGQNHQRRPRGALQARDGAHLRSASVVCAGRHAPRKRRPRAAAPPPCLRAHSAPSAGRGWGNNGNVARIAGREFLTANKHGVWLAMAATAPFIHRSCGYVGTTDGWQDLADNFKLDHEFASAPNGNIALIGEIDLSRGYRFTVGLGFGFTLHAATTNLFQSLGTPFIEHRTRFVEQWARVCGSMHPLEEFSGDGGMLYRRSRELLLAHEDKSYPGAIIASLSIPWGEARSDEDLGGYHLVWTRDMINSAAGLMAAGDMVRSE